ncbi:DUF5995 family protein [Geodermatophilus sp. SYSU D00815]
MSEQVDALIARMSALLAELTAGRDPARFFLGTYLRVTEAVRAALDDGRFEDPAWLAEWDTDFAGFYLDALEAHRRDPASPPAPWRLAFGARAQLRPEAHVLLGVNAHINNDLPQSLARVIPPAHFGDPAVLARRERDHRRIDGVLASRVGAEDLELRRAGDPRTWLDHLLTPVNRLATRLFLTEARQKVWANAVALDRARAEGDDAYRRRVAELERLSAARVADLLRPGPVLVRLAVHGFGVTLPPG